MFCMNQKKKNRTCTIKNTNQKTNKDDKKNFQKSKKSLFNYTNSKILHKKSDQAVVSAILLRQWDDKTKLNLKCR